MNKVLKILENARNGIPQALARFNDGEVGIMVSKNFVAARGQQKGCLELQAALIDAAKYEQENYWKGYPCPKCWPKHSVNCRRLNVYNPEYKWNTIAVVNSNRNLEMFSKGLPVALKGKKVVWVSSDDQKLDDLDFDIIAHGKFHKVNTWKYYERVFSFCMKNIRPRRVFLFSLGPTARVIVRTLFQIRPDATYLDIGSTYEPVTRGIKHKCHLGKSRKCDICN